MKQILTRLSPCNALYHIVRGNKILGKHTELWGDCSGLKGYCTGLWGYCTGLRGDLDECEITAAERDLGIDIQSLVKEE